MSRRALVAGGAGAAILCSDHAAAASPSRCIDVHHHVFPTDYLERAPGRMSALLRSLPGVANWRAETALVDMDRDGVGTAVLSFPTPRSWPADILDQRALARACNEYYARLVADHPGRFGLFAGLPPLTDVDGALAEIEYAFATLGADGVRVMSVYGDKWLGDASFTRVWEELDRRGAVVFVHPDTGDCCSALPNLASLELPLDTARTAASLWQSGALQRWPGIKFILSHGGGALPMIAGRLRDRIVAAGEPDNSGLGDPLQTFRRLYYDTANAATPPALSALRALADPEHILFGSDAPFAPIAAQRAYLARAGLSRAERRGIERANAAALLPGLGRRSISH